VRSYLALNAASLDKYKGEGYINRQGVDFPRLSAARRQGLHEPGGQLGAQPPGLLLLGVARATRAVRQRLRLQHHLAGPTIRPGVADSVPTPPSGSAAVAAGLPASAGQAGSNTNYWALHPNPVDFATIRGSSLFQLRDNLDPHGRPVVLLHARQRRRLDGRQRVRQAHSWQELRTTSTCRPRPAAT